MTKGKYADRAKNRRIEELEQRTRELESALAAEKSARHDEREAHAEELRSQRVDAALSGANLAHKKMVERLDEIANGFSAATWKAQRIAMTEALSRLFFAGYLDWDRMEGDVAVLRFINTHGDLDTWFYLTDKIGHGSNRAVLRQRAKNDGHLSALGIERDVEKVRLGVGAAAKQLEQDRLALNAVVDRAREAFVKSSAADLDLEAEPTEDEREIHKAALAAVDEFVKKFRQAK